MPDDDFDDPESNDSSVIRELRKKAEKTDTAEAALQAANTKIAILEAGLGDLTEIQRKAILSTHEGELTADALKTTASQLGFTKADSTGADEGLPLEEQQAQQRVAAATSGAPASEAQQKTQVDEINAFKDEKSLMEYLAANNMLAGDSA